MSVCICTPRQKETGRFSIRCTAHNGHSTAAYKERKKPLTVLQSYKNDFEWIQDKYQAELRLFASRVRKYWVIPACKKYNLTFMSGNGTFFFISEKKRSDIHNQEEAVDAGISKGLVQVFELLNMEIDQQHWVGDYVHDVTKEDVEAEDERRVG